MSVEHADAAAADSSTRMTPDAASIDACDDRAISRRTHESCTQHDAPMELTPCLVPSRAWCQVDKACKLSRHDADAQRLFPGCNHLEDNAGTLSRASCAAADVPGAKACLVPRRQHQHAVAADASRDGDARPRTDDGKHATSIGATAPRSPLPAAADVPAAVISGAKAACLVPRRKHHQADAADAVRDGDAPQHADDGEPAGSISVMTQRSTTLSLVSALAADAEPGAKASLVPSRQPRQLEATSRPQAIRRYDSDAPARWAAARRQYHPYGSRDKRCHAPGCKQALARARSLTAVCTTVGCAALVSVQAATRKARKAGRTILTPGDGCASRACAGPNHRPAKHSARQQQMASAALHGKRRMVVMPTGTEDAEFQPLSASEADAAASRALEQPVLPAAPRPGGQHVVELRASPR